MTTPPLPSSDLYYADGETVLQRLPARLYKFSALGGERLDWMRSLVIDSSLYFASPRSFNDPLDCRVPPMFDADPSAKRSYWTRNLLRQSPAATPEEVERFVEHGSRLTDDPAKQRDLCEGLFNIAAETGVACFTQTAKEMLFWSYYANGHNGIAVEFNWSARTIEMLGKQLLPFEVNYRTQFPEVNFYTNTKGELIHSLLSTKAMAWSHEQEWRIVLPDGPQLVQLPGAMITGVVFGMRLDQHLEEQVREWISLRAARHGGPPLKPLRAVHVHGGFDIELVDA